MLVYSQITEEIIGAALEVHKTIGPGLLESAYQKCLIHEFIERKICFTTETPVPVRYKGIEIDCGYRLDFLVNDLVVVEIKSVERLLPVHEAQVLTYLRLMNKPVGLLINFNVYSLKTGIRRLVLTPPTQLDRSQEKAGES